MKKHIYPIKIALVVLLLLGSALGLYAVKTGSLPFLSKAFANPSYLQLSPTKVTVGSGEEFQTHVVLLPNGNEVMGVDLVINYDPQYLEAKTVTSKSTVFDKFDYTIDPINGRITVLFLAYDDAQPKKAITDTTQLAALTFGSKNKGGSTEITLVSSPQTTDDSNISIVQGEVALDALQQPSASVKVTIDTQDTKPRATRPPVPTSTAGKLGLQFGLGEGTKPLLASLKLDTDMADMLVMNSAGPRITWLKELATSPVQSVCIARSLTELKTSIQAVKQAGTICEYFAYNPEKDKDTPQEELDNLVASVTSARAMVKTAKSKLMLGPGMALMLELEKDAPQLFRKVAALSDAYLMQTQMFQIDKANNTKLPPESYAEEVARIVQELKGGNADIKIIAQMISYLPDGSFFTIPELVDYTEAIVTQVSTIRLYVGNDPDKLTTITSYLQAIAHLR